MIGFSHWCAFVGLMGLCVSPGASLHAQCPDGSPPPCREPARAATAPPPTSVAVLYFDNLSSDSTDAYLADGLTEEVTSRLGEIQRLQIKRPNRAAVRRLRDSVPDLAGVGRVLRVRYLVEGSVRRAGPRVRVSVHLVGTADGFRVWGADYDRSSEDLLSLEEDIAREVATGIAGRLAPAERAALGARPTRNPAAYDHYLRGNFYIAQRTEPAMLRAIEEYEAALRLDPRLVKARARIAYTYALALDGEWRLGGLSPDSELTRGLAAADRALALDSSDADAWMARGYLMVFRNPRTLEGAVQAFERAVSLDPNNDEAHHQFGYVLWTLGQDSAAVRAFRRALAIDPGRLSTMQHLGWLYLERGHFEDARRWLDSAITQDPGFLLAYDPRTRLRLLLGDTTGARADAQVLKRLQWDPLIVEEIEAIIAAQRGDVGAATARIAEVMRQTPDTLTPSSRAGVALAAVLAAAGDPERAIDLLERMPPSAYAWCHLRAPEFDPVRGNPRFQRLVAAWRPPGAPR